MGYENNSRPKKKEIADLILDAKFDLDDLKEDIKKGTSGCAKLCEYIEFMSETLTQAADSFRKFKRKTKKK